MSKLPEEVTMTLAQSVVAESETKREVPDEEGLLYKLFSKLAKMFSQSASEDADGEAEPESTKVADGSCSNSTSYGYPPAYGYPSYGVPAQVMVDLLKECLSVLSQLEIEDKKLAEQAKKLIQRIKEALGVPTAATVASQMSDPLREIRVALKVQQGTQPVLSPQEAAERLEKAWDAFKDAMVSETADVGAVFDAVFALRAAVDSAIRTLKTVAATEQSSQAESAEANEAVEASAEDRAEDSAAQAEEATASNQGSSSEEKNDMQASASDDQMHSNGSSEDQALSLITGLVQRVDEIAARLAALETLVKERKRVTQFVASSNATKEEEDQSDDLLKRWLSAKTEVERRKLLREAQKLLAAPRKLD